MKEQEPNRFLLHEGTSGSLWRLRQIVGAGASIKLGAWTIEAYPQSDFASVLAPEPGLAWAEHRQMLEKGLDIMSASAGQHYETRLLDSKTERIRWDWEDDRFAVEIQTLWDVSLPITIYTQSIRDVDDPNKPPSPRYAKAMRYFRLSQITDNPAASFQNLFLCFESLLDASYPKKRGREEDWLTEAVNQEFADYQIAAQEEIQARGGVGADLADIYEVRLGLFHAKPSRNPIHPFDQVAEERIRSAYWKLATHVLQLLRHLNLWPGQSVLETQRSLNNGAEILLEIEKVGLLVKQGETPTSDFDMEFVEFTKTGRFPMEFAAVWDLPKGFPEQLLGYRWVGKGNIPLHHRFSVQPITGKPVRLGLKMNAAGGPRHVVKGP